jgi:hypothetical protein
LPHSTNNDPFQLAEHVAETLDVGPGTRLFEVDCGRGELLVPFHQNGYNVGGTDGDAEAIAAARAQMPDGNFQVATAPALDPAVPWHVVIWRFRPGSVDVSDAAVAEVDYMRGVLARMFAKATHAIAVLDLSDRRREWILHALTEIGATAIEFDVSNAAEGRCNVFARV